MFDHLKQLSVTLKDLILLPVLYEKDSKQVAFSIGVHIEAKKLLNMFAFSQKSETNLPSTKVALLGVFYYRANNLTQSSMILVQH